VKLKQAQFVAEQVVKALCPFCERIEVAGSVRREKAEPKDIEIVFIPKMGPSAAMLFGTSLQPATDAAIDDLITAGFWTFDTQVKRNGPKYKRLIHAESGVVIELFRADRDNWGYIYVLRTGPGAFSKMLVSAPWAGGVRPLEVGVKDGYVYQYGVLMSLPEERDFFELWGLPEFPPASRNADTIRAWAEQRREVRDG